MTGRQRPWPRQWLMTDERIGEQLWEAIDRLPVGSGIVFRHYSAEPQERAALAQKIARTCRDRRLTLAVARDEELARAVGADLVHNPAKPLSDLPFSVAVHSVREADAAREAGAALVFVSPIYPTRSHPRQQPLSEDHAVHIARAAAVPAIALGGVDAGKFERLQHQGFHGWAAIDAWLA